jgi:predicted DsbA family dithiol-disulfide isomerase
MKIPGFVWVLVTLIIGGGFLLLLVTNKNNQINQNVKLPIDIEVFVDYNCPHCAEFEPYVEDVVNTYGSKVNLQFKYLPFLSASSVTYAQAAEAAKLQGKFNEYHKAMFKWIFRQSSPQNSDAVYQYTDEEKEKYSVAFDMYKLAEDLKLDMDKFKTDVESDTVKNTVLAQKNDAVKRLGGASTPAVFIFGQKFDDLGNFKTKVGELIQLAEKK